MSDDQPIHFKADELEQFPSGDQSRPSVVFPGCDVDPESSEETGPHVVCEASGYDPIHRLTAELQMSTSKSMESIALDVSRCEDSDATSLAVAIDGIVIGGAVDDGEEPMTSADPSEALPSTKRTQEEGEVVADIRSYFQPPSEDAKAGVEFAADAGEQFFDKLQSFAAEDDSDARVDSVVEPMARLLSRPDAEDDQEPSSLSPLLPLSPIQPDAVEAPLAEVKGDGLRPTPSTKNLTRFFTDGGGSGGGGVGGGGNAPGGDAAGREFFEAFTAAEEPRPTRSPHLSLSESDQLLLPPQTPPISASLQVSPLHRASTSSQPDGGATSLPGGGGGDDPFSAVLQANDSDRRHDAWIASEATRRALVTRVTGSDAGASPTEPKLITIPKFVVDTPLGDPVYDHVLRFLGEQEARKRELFAADSVSQDEAGLRQLIASYSLRSAVDLTARLLADCGQGNSPAGQPVHHTPYSLQLWFSRISLLAKLHMYAEAEAECESFGNLDTPELYFEYHADEYGGRRGSMVPFQFRLLHAEMPQYLGKTQESLDKLYYLHAVVLKIGDNLQNGLAEDGSLLQLDDISRADSIELWESREIRLLYSIGNGSLLLKDYAMTVRIFEGLLEKDSKNRESLLCGIGRIYVQMGDMVTAEDYFTQASHLTDPDSSEHRSRNVLNRGLLALGYNQFREAYHLFKEAINIYPSNTVATNNMSVCALYMGQLSDALHSLEGLVLSDPGHFLQESLLFNLCTLYELESSHAIHKKEVLLRLVNEHCGNGFNVACLKMA